MTILRQFYLFLDFLFTIIAFPSSCLIYLVEPFLFEMVCVLAVGFLHAIYIPPLKK